MTKINYDYYPDEIAECICKLAYVDDPNGEIQKSCEDAIYHMKNIAENPFNSEFFRTFYNILVAVTEKHIYD